MPIALFTHPSCHQHEMDQDHPECPARLDSINDRLIAAGIDFVIHQHQASPADREHLEAAHDPDYVAAIYALVPESGTVRLDSDTLMNPYSLTAALNAAGAVTDAVDLVMAGPVRQAFCAVRPPGHHAERDRAMGFCIFNNVAVGAIHAINAHGLERIAICDFDVHHGNGTENILQRNPNILFCSSFQHPFYPFTSLEQTASNVIKTPLPAGTNGEAFRQALTRDWLPALRAFQPQLLMISAGFDGHLEDAMGQWRLREADYHWITLELRAIAKEFTEGRIVSVLEGGYDLSALGRSVAAHLDALLGH